MNYCFELPGLSLLANIFTWGNNEVTTVSGGTPMENYVDQSPPSNSVLNSSSEWHFTLEDAKRVGKFLLGALEIVFSVVAIVGCLAFALPTYGFSLFGIYAGYKGIKEGSALMYESVTGNVQSTTTEIANNN